MGRGFTLSQDTDERAAFGCRGQSVKFVKITFRHPQSHAIASAFRFQSVGRAMEHMRSSAWSRTRPTPPFIERPLPCTFSPRAVRRINQCNDRQRHKLSRRRAGHPEFSCPINGFERIVASTLVGINPNLTIVKFQTFQQQDRRPIHRERLHRGFTSCSRAVLLFRRQWPVRS